MVDHLPSRLTRGELKLRRYANQKTFLVGVAKIEKHGSVRPEDARPSIEDTDQCLDIGCWRRFLSQLLWMTVVPP